MRATPKTSSPSLQTGKWERLLGSLKGCDRQMRMVSIHANGKQARKTVEFVESGAHKV